MDYIINENQLRIILENESKSSLSNDISNLNEFTKNLIDNAKVNFGINLSLLSTWGASVGGLVAPLDEYIRSNNLEITEEQITLVLIGCISTLMIDNKPLFAKIYRKCKNDGIENVLVNTITKGKELKSSFKIFLSSLDFSVKNISAFISYAFLIPIIPDIQSIIQNSEDIDTVTSRIVSRILASGVIMLSADVLDTLIRKIVLRLK